MAARTTIKSALDPLLQATLYDRFAKQVAAVFIRNQNIAISCISALYVSNVLISFLEEWEVRALPAMNYVTLILQPLFDRIQAISRDYVDETDLCSRLLKLFQVLWRACSKQMLPMAVLDRAVSAIQNPKGCVYTKGLIYIGSATVAAVGASRVACLA